MTRFGLQIHYNHHALEATQERLFPKSKHRSKRIHKKLLKKFGGEFRMKPCIWQIGDKIVAHPSFKTEIERTLMERNP